MRDELNYHSVKNYLHKLLSARSDLSGVCRIMFANEQDRMIFLGSIYSAYIGFWKNLHPNLGPQVFYRKLLEEKIDFCESRL